MPPAVTVGLTPRDRDILSALDRCPLTAHHILKLSATFSSPFTTDRAVRDRLFTLASRGLILPCQYALPGQGLRNYYVRTLEAWKCLQADDEAARPGHRSFEPLSLSRLAHWQALADFVVHTLCAVHRAGLYEAGDGFAGLLQSIDFHPENALKLTIGDEQRFPDCAFVLTRPDGQRIRFFVEIDNSTESVSSTVASSWTRKVQFYEAYRDHCRKAAREHQLRVLVLTTGEGRRLQNILAHAAATMVRKQRSIFYGMPLGEYLASEDPLAAPLFLDNLQRVVPLLARHPRCVSELTAQNSFLLTVRQSVGPAASRI